MMLSYSTSDCYASYNILDEVPSSPLASETYQDRSALHTIPNLFLESQQDSTMFPAQAYSPSTPQIVDTAPPSLDISLEAAYAPFSGTQLGASNTNHDYHAYETSYKDLSTKVPCLLEGDFLTNFAFNSISPLMFPVLCTS
jgi:hypothetical protein